MHEDILKEYFEGKISPQQLNDDLIGSSVRKGPKEISQEIVDMDEDFLVKPRHIIRLLHDILNEKIDSSYLEVISFALMRSDHFSWDYEDKQNDVMADLFHEWASPEMNYDLSLENIKKCLSRLEEK
jgi:hypothetical protein